MPLVAILTETKDLLLYDIQKGKLINYLTGHSKRIIKVVADQKARANFFTLGDDLKIIFWGYTDKWSARTFDFRKILAK